jgi:hypothetical protein
MFCILINDGPYPEDGIEMVIGCFVDESAANKYGKTHVEKLNNKTPWWNKKYFMVYEILEIEG